MRSLRIPVASLILAIATTASAAASASNHDASTFRAAEARTIVTLANAYVSRDDKLISHYAHLHGSSLALYASALYDLVNKNSAKLNAIGNECIGASGTNDPIIAASSFACLLVVARGAGIFESIRARAKWLAETKEYYTVNEKFIQMALGSDVDTVLSGISLPSAQEISKWPREYTTLNPEWNKISTISNLANATIDDRHVKFIIDTGAIGINISNADVTKYKIASKLIPLHYSAGAGDETGGFGIQYFVINKLTLGPLTIHNAYVSVSDAATTFGISALSSLRRFYISSTGIYNSDKQRLLDNYCSKMMFSRMPISDAFEYPFFVVKTSAGSLGLMVDTGMRTYGTASDSSVTLSARAASTLIGDKKITVSRNAIGTLVQNGKVRRFKLKTFDISVFGVKTQGSISNSDIFLRDSDIAGTFNANVLKYASIGYDFTNDEMCVHFDDVVDPK